MATEILQSFPTGPTSDEAVRAFERRIGHTLPADYRAFLLTHNGGRPEPGGVEFELEGRHVDNEVHCFFPLCEAGVTAAPNSLDELHSWPLASAWDDLQHDLEHLYHKQLADPLLPIGTDGSSNYFCLVLAGDRRGAIVFLEHELAETTPLAESFSAFLACLHAIRQPDCAADVRAREMERAAASANAKFQQHDYRSVVALLTPFADVLSPAMQRKLDYARKKLR